MSVARTVRVTSSRCHPVAAASRRIHGKLQLMILLLLLALTASAQESTKDIGEASLEELQKIQVFSASKHLQSTRDAPAAVTVITADEIQKYGFRTLADILQSMSGFYITYDRDYSFVGVRGFGRLGDSNNRILVLIDGHRINDNVFGEPYLGTEFLVDVDLIERVEIIRGPSSSLYGADAFFAVINVITRKPPQLKGVELSFAPASFGTYQGRASYGGQYKGIDMLLSGTFYDSQGQTLFFPEFDSPATNFGITRNTDYEPRLGLIYHLFDPTTLKLLYGTAFRAPEPFEVTPDYGSVYENNLQLKPEEIRSDEVIVEQTMGQHFTLTGNLFRNDIDRLISIETDPGSGQLIYRNFGGAVAKGVEIELAGRASNGLQGSASYSFTHTVGVQPEPVLPNSPQHLGKLNLIVPVVQQKLFASLDAQYTSPRQTLAGNTVSGFSVFNVTLLGHTLGKHLDVSASVYNLLDKKYYDPGRPEDVQDAIQQDGRNFRIKLTGRF